MADSKINRVALIANLGNERLQKGDVEPCRVSVEPGSSVIMVVNSDDKLDTSVNTSNFRVDMGLELSLARSVQLYGISLPKVGNVNFDNYRLDFRHEDDGGALLTAYIATGYFNPTSLCNALTIAINTALLAKGSLDTVTCSFSPITKKFTVTSVLGLKFFFSNTCSFYLKGRFLANLPGFDISLNPAVIGSTTWTGGVAGMIFSRYITVHSDTLNLYSKANSIFSTNYNISECIGVFDLNDLYNDADMDVGASGNVKLYSYLENKKNPVINLCNPSLISPAIIDFEIQDEFEDYYLEKIDTQNGAFVPGLTLYLKVTF